MGSAYWLMIDGVMRAAVVVAILVSFALALPPRLTQPGTRAREIAYGAVLGLISTAAMIIPIETEAGHLVDLRTVPLILAAPILGLVAGCTASIIAAAGQVLLWNAQHLEGFYSMLVASALGLAIALMMGWRLSGPSHTRIAARPVHLLWVALASPFAVLLPEVHWTAGEGLIHPGYEKIWLPHLLLVPLSTIAIGAILITFLSRRRLLASLQEANEQIAAIATNIPGVLYRRAVGPHGELIFRYVNEQSSDIFGLPPETIIQDASTFLERIHPDDRARVHRALTEAAQGTPPPVFSEYRFVRPDGQIRWIQGRSQVNQAASLLAGETIADGIAFDATAQKEAELAAEAATRKAQWAGSHDFLTALPYWPALAERIAACAAAPTPGTALLALTDLRDSNLVNELFGISAGDERLVEAARRLSAAAPPGSVVARLGGDEFAIFIEHPGPDAAAAIAGIADALRAPFLISGQSVPMSADFGYVLTRPGLTDAAELRKLAGIALQTAGGAPEAAIVAFTSRMEAERNGQRIFDAALAEAIDQGALTIWAQPIAATADMRLLGREALVRWDRAGHGPVPPDLFVARAEAIGLWPKLDALVLKAACGQAAAWPADTWVSVNLSPGWFILGTVIPLVEDALRETGLPPRRLCIEITERVFIEDSRAARDMVNGLNRLGVSVAIDDFGSAFSSLNYIQMLPIQKLKIDKSFIDNLMTSRKSRAIVRSVIQLCAEIGLEVVAEGVETQAQMDWLRDHHCSAVQGYLTGRPQPIEAAGAPAGAATPS
ncbi:putative bifunctional diguanylate cyclase/phosphodiesterase [Azorhizobium doebereinerae]|uniref:putative bifunctional diguanylate cyclase/phosphodiesterase n=1 Tax=Azorhizobium doebereinerae TaxID=281091 RepID=UPI00041C435E|nr:EAL domain-containing protein [Azorhizobium doebereinerae]